MGLHPNIRPLGFILAFLGFAQGLVWSIAALVALLSEVLDICPSPNDESYVTKSFHVLCGLYIHEYKSNGSLVHNGVFQIFMIMYLVLSLMWFAVSCWLFWCLRYQSLSPIMKSILIWIVIAVVTSLLDAVLVILLAIDFNWWVSVFDNKILPIQPIATPVLLLMHMIRTTMTLAARGYTLWLLNVLVALITLKFIFGAEPLESPVYDKQSKPALPFIDQKSNHYLDMPSEYPEKTGNRPFRIPKSELFEVSEPDEWYQSLGQVSAQSWSQYQQPPIEQNYAKIGRPNNRAPIKVPPPKAPSSVRSFGTTKSDFNQNSMQPGLIHRSSSQYGY